MDVLLCLSTALATAPSADVLKEAWESVDAAHWVFRPEFDAADYARLAAGKVVKRRENLEGPDRVVGALWTAADRDDLWVALQDEDHFEVVSGYVDEDLPGSVFADRFLYQRISLPWPFADRQWVVRIRSNRDLLQRSNGRIWERSWEVSERRGASIEAPKAVWVEQNSGGWVVCRAGTGHLLLYTVRATIGGNIPDEAATQWALLTVSGMLHEIDERARLEVKPHYRAGHAPVERPDGSRIPTY